MSSSEISTTNTIMQRHLAAIADNLIAALLGLVAAKLLNPDAYRLQLVVFIGVYLSYFFLLELILGRTLGKMLTGLVVTRIDGSPAKLKDILIRTLFRLIEVNPAFLGYAPAALSIILTRHNQRLADRIVGTIVVPRERLDN